MHFNVSNCLVCFAYMLRLLCIAVRFHTPIQLFKTHILMRYRYFNNLNKIELSNVTVVVQHYRDQSIGSIFLIHSSVKIYRSNFVDNLEILQTTAYGLLPNHSERLVIQQWRLASYDFATHPDINLKNQLQITLTKRITKFILSHTDTIFGSNQNCPRLMPKLAGCNSINQINLSLDVAQSICV